MSRVRTNEEVAAVFGAIAVILEGRQENPFKIKAYRSAVRTLEDLAEPVADVAARGELRKLPGFGEAITSKTLEILATGTCELFERLKKEQEDAEGMEGDVLAAPSDVLTDVPVSEDPASPW